VETKVTKPVGPVATPAKNPPAAPLVASGNPPGPAPGPNVPVTAKNSAPLFGGLRGGRKRADGLKPGSPEAVAADRKKDADRKKRERQEARAILPPEPLPAATAAPGPALAPEKLHVDFPDQEPADGGDYVPGVVASPGALVPWLGKKIEPVSVQLVEVMESMAARQVAKRARLANLPDETLNEVESSLAWEKGAKKLLAESSAEVAAKYLNKAGISAEYQPEITLAGAVLTVLYSHNKVLKRLDKLIAAANPAGPAKKP
jgi:hypothetical protein